MDMIKENDADIICLQETWLRKCDSAIVEEIKEYIRTMSIVYEIWYVIYMKTYYMVNVIMTLNECLGTKLFLNRKEDDT